MPGPQSFPRTERLLHNCQFRALYYSAPRYHGRLMILFAQTQPDGPRQLGVVTSRRVGNAVARNRARRLLRESWRLHKQEFADHTRMVLVAKPAIAGQTRATVEAELLALADRAGLRRTP